jgi:eukaryotic-like serine/threonine-protein kinase
MAPLTDRRVGGRYELTRRIARGGGGTVWAGYDHLLEREVAVKHVQIPDELPATERDKVRARVRSEARAAARLLHPSAVTIFDVVADAGDVHLVLELVEEPTLDERVLREGPLDEEIAAKVGLGLLDVLVAAHRRGIVHRDVKPSNIFVTDDGAVKLSDFGIAQVEGEMRLTRTGATMGSPQFIAPEQALGHDAAPAADLWGLGASLYLAVEGVPPFERNNAVATVHAVVHESARAFQRADELAPIIARLLEKEPSARPHVDELRDELSRVAGVTAAPVPARPTPIVPISSAPDVAGADASAADQEAVADEPDAREATPPPDVDPVEDEEARGDEVTSGDEVTARPVGAAAAAGPVAAGEALTASVDAPPTPPPAPAETVDPGPEPAPSTSSSSDGPRRWRPVAAALALVAIVTVGSVGLSSLGDDGAEQAADDPETAAPADDTDGDDPAAEDDPAADDGEGETTPDEMAADPDEGAEDPPEDPAPDEGGAETDVPEAEVPEDWQVVDGPAYQVAVPSSWEVSPGQGRIVDHSDPDSSTYLRVDWTPDPRPDPVANWQELSADLASRFDDYQELQLSEVTFRGQPAALLEYTYTAGGAELRAYNLNILAGDRAYALNLQSTAQDWDEVEPQFASMVGGFQPS